MKEAWREDEPQTNEYIYEELFRAKKLSPACALEWAGVSSLADVEHVWAVGIAPEDTVISVFVLDAENNQWSPEQQEFREFSWSDHCY
ncbi:hypothetical protein HC928_17680 [bacterium]|nr:hypothetical protein [bacterium]